jgi:hypothetical protein
MPIEIVICPHCHVRLRQVPDLVAGTPVTCPRCRTEFVLDGTGQLPSPSQPAGEPFLGRAITEEPIPPALLPSPIDSDAPAFDPMPDDFRLAECHDVPLSGNHVLNVSEWTNLAAAHIHKMFFSTFGFLLLMCVKVVLAYWLLCLGPLALVVFLPALLAGPLVVSLAELRGQRWKLDDFYGAIPYFFSLFSLHLVLGLVAGGYLLFAVTLVSHLEELDDPLLLVAGQGSLLGCGIALVCVLLRAYFFAVPLIVDRGWDAVAAIRGSWQLTRGHTLGMVGVGLLLAILNWFGLMTVGLGLLLTVPLTYLTVAAGYLCTIRQLGTARVGVEREDEL